MSNQYKYPKHSPIPNYNRQSSNGNQQHSRAATYANKTKANTYKNKPNSHLSSNSMASSNSNPPLNDIETTRSDMRDILWQNAELLQSDPNYRKKVWRYMNKVFYVKQSKSNRYSFDHWKKKELPNTIRESAPNPHETQNRLNVNQMTDNKAATAPDREFDIITKSKLKLLLDREETYSDFLINSNPNQVINMNKVRPKMVRILEAYACANENKLALSGAVQLCAVILTTFSMKVDDGSMNSSSTEINDNDCSDTFNILQILTEIMHKYSLEDEKLMKDETLLLIDVLCVNEDKLVKKLNQLHIDVIDLSVFVSSWIRCLFGHHFEIEFVQRVIDLVLLEGPSVLIAIVYGILQFIKNDILQCDTHYDVFEKLAGNKLKNYLKNHQFIARVINKAQVLFTEQNYKYVIKGRENKSWADLLVLPGDKHHKHFRLAKGVGDKNKVQKAYKHWRRESRKNITNAYLGAEESSDDSEEDGHHASAGAHHHSSSSFNWNANNSADLVHEYEKKLQDANETIMKLQTMQIKEEDCDDLNKENASADMDNMLPPSGPTMIEHNNSLVIHEEETESQISESHGNKHKKQAPTLSDILYTSEEGDKIYREPLTDDLQPREIQCRTENWTDSWKNALNSLTDASISMQGYLCKMTASKFNSRGTLDKIQRRWFVLRGNYMTYYKTNLHTQPKSDKCVNLLGYKVNPVIHSKSKYAFELISAPKENQHKKSKSMMKKSMSSNFEQRSMSSNDCDSSSRFVERTKFILIPDLDVNEHKQREIRDKWVKSLRLATKGAFLWDVLLNLKVESPFTHSAASAKHYDAAYEQHVQSHTAFTTPSYNGGYAHNQHHHHSPHAAHAHNLNHNHYDPHIVSTPPSYSKRNKAKHQFHNNFKHGSDSLQSYNRRHYNKTGQKNANAQQNYHHDYRI